jgi:hypothetical protein
MKKKKAAVEPINKMNLMKERIIGIYEPKLERLRAELKRRIVHEQFYQKNKTMDEAIEYADIELERVENGTDKGKVRDRSN